MCAVGREGGGDKEGCLAGERCLALCMRGMGWECCRVAASTAQPAGIPEITTCGACVGSGIPARHVSSGREGGS